MFSSFVHKLTPIDKTLLYKAILRWRPHSTNYEDSWGYIIQATRHGGFRWYEPDSDSLLFFGRKSADDPTLVVPNFFATPHYLEEVVKVVQKELNAPRTILKNINPANARIFTPYGFRPYEKSESWDTFVRYDDQTYPQLLVDLEKVMKHEGRTYRGLRTVIKKRLPYTIRSYQKNDKDAVLRIFSMKDNTTNKTLSGQQGGMYYESHAMYPDASINKFVIVAGNHEVIGFTAFSEITSDAVASAASLFKPNDGDITTWGQYLTLCTMYQKGFKAVNFGGNESSGAYQFLREKFCPIEELPRTHLVYHHT